MYLTDEVIALPVSVLSNFFIDENAIQNVVFKSAFSFTCQYQIFVLPVSQRTPW